MTRPSFDSDTYPYERILTGANQFNGADEIPLKIIRYLLDLPDQYGYEPTDDNSRPRVRLAKYLWHDGANPLSKELPTPTQKLSLLYDGDHPDINTDAEKKRHPQGYRVFPQIYWYPSELTAKTVLKSYIGRVIPVSDFQARIGVAFEVLVNATAENTTRSDAYSRAYAIETCLIAALDGVSIAGIGTVHFSRPSHIDNGSGPLHDNGTHVGREIHFSIDWMESNEGCQTIEACN